MNNIKDIFNDEMGQIPNDITILTPEQLRAAHSYWTNCHNYSSSTLALVQQKIKELKRLREIKFKKLFLANKNFKQTNDIARYNAELSNPVKNIDDRLNKLEQQNILWSNLVSQCDLYRILCSREQSYREVELSTYFSRGGAGK